MMCYQIDHKNSFSENSYNFETEPLTNLFINQSIILHYKSYNIDVLYTTI